MHSVTQIKIKHHIGNKLWAGERVTHGGKAEVHLATEGSPDLQYAVFQL